MATDSLIGYATATIDEASTPLTPGDSLIGFATATIPARNRWRLVAGGWTPALRSQSRVGGTWVDLADTTVDPAYREGWGLPVFREDFTGSDLDPAIWHKRGLPGSDYLLTNTDRQGVIQQSHSYIDTDNDELILKTTRRASPINDDAYTRWYDTGYCDTMPRSGFTGFAQRYGRFEVRAHSLHPGDTAGLVPAFWIRTNEDGGEVDVFEWVGTPTGYNESAVATSYPNQSRFGPDGKGSFSAFFESTGQTNNAAGNAYHESTWTLPTADDWHLYAMEWTPDRISCYCDGLLIVEVKRGVQPRRNNGTVNSSISDGALILDGGFGGSAKAHIRLSVHVGWPYAGYASPTYTATPHHFRFSHVYAWAYDGQE